MPFLSEEIWQRLPHRGRIHHDRAVPAGEPTVARRGGRAPDEAGDRHRRRDPHDPEREPHPTGRRARGHDQARRGQHDRGRDPGRAADRGAGALGDHDRARRPPGRRSRRTRWRATPRCSSIWPASWTWPPSGTGCSRRSRRPRRRSRSSRASSGVRTSSSVRPRRWWSVSALRLAGATPDPREALHGPRRARVTAVSRRIGHAIHAFDTVDSTQAVLARLAAEGARRRDGRHGTTPDGRARPPGAAVVGCARARAS